MITRFIEWLLKQVGSIYVWGAQGEVGFDEDWIKKMETNENNAKRAIALFEKKKKLTDKNDIAAYDCSGLIVRFLLDNNLIDSDTTAQGLYNLCKKKNRDELCLGDMVFRHNGAKITHVGVYVGDGMVIHSKGRDVGVVREHIDANGEEYWNRFGRYARISESTADEYPCVMQYKGASFVNLRKEPCSLIDDNIIGRIKKNESVLVLASDKNGWADVIKKEDSGCYKRGYCITKFLKRA